MYSSSQLNGSKQKYFLRFLRFMNMEQPWNDSKMERRSKMKKMWMKRRSRWKRQRMKWDLMRVTRAHATTIDTTIQKWQAKPCTKRSWITIHESLLPTNCYFLCRSRFSFDTVQEATPSVILRCSKSVMRLRWKQTDDRRKRNEKKSWKIIISWIVIIQAVEGAKSELFRLALEKWAAINLAHCFPFSFGQLAVWCFWAS